jgi:hypothetical protein
MIKLQNKTTGEVVVINDVRFEGERVVSEKGTKGEKFIARVANMLQEQTDADGSQYFTICEGFVRATRTKRTKKAEPTTEPVTTATAGEHAHEPQIVQSIAPTTATATRDDDNERALIAALKGLRGGNVDESRVREIVADVLREYASEPTKKTTLTTAAKRATATAQYYCEGFDKIRESVARGFYPYLWGAAGCGKSHTAEQIADALGLDFYTQTTIQFAHDVRGYGDANGNFQDTPFYKAFANGGLYFQDEYDRSLPDAAIVLNTALANGYYDFPVIGRVHAHPNFRFMAAGNTQMKGAQDGYNTGNEQDASSRDRVFYVAYSYNHDVELNAIAEGDNVLVAFVEDVRRAIKSCNIEHVVSYRATKFMHDMEDVWGAEDCLKQKTFAGLDVDAIREIYLALEDRDNRWAKAMKKLF